MVEVNTPQAGAMMGNLDNMTEMVELRPSFSVMTPITMMGTGLFGNIIALGVYRCSCPAHRNLPFYGLMQGLLWTNVVGYLAVYPLIIAACFNGLRWIGGSHACNFQGLSTLSFGMSTSLLVGCMGFERFLAVCKPELHAKRVERRKIPYLIFLVWVFAVFTAFMPIVGFGEMVQHYPGTWCFVNWRHQQTVGKLYTSILAAELSGILLLVFSCLLSVVGYSFLKLLRVVPRNSEGVVEVTGTTIRRLSVRRTRRSLEVPGSASPWLTFHYVLFASAVLICVAPVVLRIILNVSGAKEDLFATFRAMGFAESFPVSAPWIYMLLHQRLWQRLLPCCFSKHLPNTRGRYVNYRRHHPQQPRDHNFVRAEAGDGTAEETCSANNMPPNNLEASTGYKTVTDDGSTMDILTIRNVARKNQQQRSKKGQEDEMHPWKPLTESGHPRPHPSSNTKLAVYNYPLRGHVTDGPTYHLTDHMHVNHHRSDGSMRRVEYHALMRMMDEDSRENVPLDEHTELAKACTFGKESTI